MTTFRAVQSLRDEVALVRSAVDGQDHAIGELMRMVDAVQRCLDIVAVRTKHLHDDLARRSKRRVTAARKPK